VLLRFKFCVCVQVYDETASHDTTTASMGRYVVGDVVNTFSHHFQFSLNCSGRPSRQLVARHSLATDLWIQVLEMPAKHCCSWRLNLLTGVWFVVETNFTLGTSLYILYIYMYIYLYLQPVSVTNQLCAVFLSVYALFLCILRAYQSTFSRRPRPRLTPLSVPFMQYVLLL